MKFTPFCHKGIYSHFDALCQAVRLQKILVVPLLIILLLDFSRLSYAYERIISLKPNMTEVLFALGEGPHLVGVTTYCDYPVDAKKIKKVGDYMHVDVERVLRLKPDLVVNSKENSVEKEMTWLARQGIRVELFSFERLSDVFSSMERLGALLGKKEEGKRLADSLKRDLAKLSVTGVPQVLLVVGRQPLVVVGSRNLLDDLLEELGISNVAGSSRLRYPSYSVEQMIYAQPTVIVDLTMGGEKRRENWYQRYPSIPAVKNDRVYFLDIADFRASPRLIEGARKLVEVLE